MALEQQEQWQDESCPESTDCSWNIANDNPQLCTPCRSIFNQDQHISEVQLLKYRKHVRLLRTLESSARGGCNLCALLQDRILRDADFYKEVSEINVEYAVGRYQSSLCLCFRYVCPSESWYLRVKLALSAGECEYY